MMHTTNAYRSRIRLVPVITVLAVALAACGESLADLDEQEVSEAALPGDTVLVAPELVFDSAYVRSTGAGQFVHYDLTVENWSAYAAELFESRPDLPPCGLNTSASRTWVEIYDGAGMRRYGFCALGASSGLIGIWFAVGTQQEQPTEAYIELWDRARDVRVRSNVVSLDD